MEERTHTFSGEAFDPAKIKAATIRKVYDFWLAHCQSASMPLTEEIDILELEFAVGALSIIDVIDQKPRFYLRMIGSQIVERNGIDNTGLIVDEMTDEAIRSILTSSYTNVFASAEPFWIERQTFTDDHIYVYECLILPMRNVEGQVTRLLSVLDWPEAELRPT